MPEHERPREKLIEKWARALADHESLAVLLGKGSRKHNVISRAKKMIPVIDEKKEQGRFPNYAPACGNYFVLVSLFYFD
ncbi:MAG: UPF0758 domain-containing protein [Dissulfuribacterales bacterium]